MRVRWFFPPLKDEPRDESSLGVNHLNFRFEVVVIRSGEGSIL